MFYAAIFRCFMSADFSRDRRKFPILRVLIVTFASFQTTTVATTETNATTGHTLTGIPQIDYIWDPNLPRELNGYNLSDYPFYNSIPEDIDFKCDGLHDGFYASVPHKCQVINPMTDMYRIRRNVQSRVRYVQRSSADGACL